MISMRAFILWFIILFSFTSSSLVSFLHLWLFEDSLHPKNNEEDLEMEMENEIEEKSKNRKERGRIRGKERKRKIENEGLRIDNDKLSVFHDRKYYY